MEITTLHDCTIGLDIHHRQITACLLTTDRAGKVQCEFREFGTFKRNLRELATWVASHQPDEVVMESTGIYWKSPYAALEKAGIYARVVNARHVKNVPGRKTDIQDAHWLAMLSRSGLLNGSFIPPQPLREARLLSRQRQKLVGQRSAEKTRLHKLVVDAGIRLSVVITDLNGRSGNQMIRGLIKGESIEQLLSYADKRLKATEEELRDALEGDLSPSHCFALTQILRHIDHLDAQITAFDQQLVKQLADYRPALTLLTTVPGIDETSAALLLAEIGDNMDVFGCADRIASWAGLCPGNNESAGKRKSGKTRKGNYWLRRILCECAQAARRTRCQFKSKYEALAARRGTKKAIIAIAHKLLRTLFVMLKTGECYRDPQVDYEKLAVQKNAPRWMRMLKKHGYLTA